MDKIIIEQIDGHFKVTQGDKWADAMQWDEMLGLVVSLSIPSDRPCLQWMRTAEQHKAKEEYFANLKARNDIEEETPTDLPFN